jgi:uncharacterized protein YozE (UPF0346 family)
MVIMHNIFYPYRMQYRNPRINVPTPCCAKPTY